MNAARTAVDAWAREALERIHPSSDKVAAHRLVVNAWWAWNQLPSDAVRRDVFEHIVGYANVMQPKGTENRNVDLENIRAAIRALEQAASRLAKVSTPVRVRIALKTGVRATLIRILAKNLRLAPSVPPPPSSVRTGLMRHASAVVKQRTGKFHDDVVAELVCAYYGIEDFHEDAVRKARGRRARKSVLARASA